MYSPWFLPLAAIALGVAILLGVSVYKARAEQAHCSQVRVMVASYGHTAALAWARRNGYSEEQIREARRCLARARERGQ